MPYKTIAEVRAANKSTNHFFFSRDTMRFWQTRIHGGLRRGRFFITPEDNYDRSRRQFSIREALEDGTIKTPRAGRYSTLEAAREALKGLL